MTTPKLPRAVTAHRDVRETKTPPVGVAVQIASPTGRSRIPGSEDLQTAWPEDEHTPVGSTAIAAIDYRTKQLRNDLETTNNRLFSVAENMADVRVEIAGLKGAVNTLIPLVQHQIGGALQNHTVTMTAQLELGKAAQLDVIEQKKWSREMWAKVLGLFGTGGVAATLIIMFAAGKC